MICDNCKGKMSKTSSKEGRRWKCHHGDSAAIIRSFEAATFEAIISDPPYAAGATSLLGRLKSSADKYQNSDTKNKLPAIAGDSMLPEAWQTMMHGVLLECERVLKPGGDLLFFCDWRSHSAMLGVIGSIGLSLKTTLTWDKGRGCRPHKNGFRSQSEWIIHARKPGTLPRPKDVYLDGVYKFSTRSHQTAEAVA